MKITRKSVLKFLGVSPFVATALLSDGASAARLKTCQNARYACFGGCDTDCQYQCSGLSGCPWCDVCTDPPPVPCAEQDAACPPGSGCSLECLRACGRGPGSSTCSSCDVCRQ